MNADIMRTLRVAKESDMRVRMIYEGEKGISERTVRVLGLDDENAKCYCYLRRRNRVFKIANILSAVILDR